MKKFLMIAAVAVAAVACETKPEPKTNSWIVDRFDDIKVLRYEVPGFDELPLEEKLLVYYLTESAQCGRDIIFDQNFKYNLAIRRTLEAVYEKYQGDRTTREWTMLEKYLKKVWFANGIHHHYSNEKFQPEFSKEFFLTALETLPSDAFDAELLALRETVVEAIFNPELYKTRLNQTEGEDLLLTSCGNYYEGVTQAEAEAFYAAMEDPSDPTPISYGLNSKLVKDPDGKIREHVYKIGGMYSPALEKVVYWLEKAHGVANPTQKKIIAELIAHYCTGSLESYDKFNILWAQDTVSNVDFVNGFTETYGDPLGNKAAWESIANFVDKTATHRTQVISDNAQWFEDQSPVNPAYRKEVVKGVSAKVITAAMLGGECYPATPIGINLPNADWIRKDYGSKSVTIDNITNAYSKSSEGDGFLEEFMLREEDRARIVEHGKLADDLMTDLHECLGHGSGQLAPGVSPGALGNYRSTLEETRADLYALYYLGDPKMIELGLISTPDVAKAEYAKYMMNGLMTQLSRVELGKNVEESHMRNRKLVAEWCYEHGKADKTVELVRKGGKTYIVVNDFDKLRELFGKLLFEMQRIKSEGDYEAGKAIVEKYAVKVDPKMHKEILTRYAKLHIAPYSGFVNVRYQLWRDAAGKITDVKIVPETEDYIKQHLRYSKKYSFLPHIN